MAEENVRGLAEATVGKLKEIVETNTVIGDAITAPDGSVVIPVSKVNVGFGSGGVDFKNNPDPAGGPSLGGGCGGGVTITPVGFLVLSANGNVKMLQVADKNQSVDRAMNVFPDILDQISKFIDSLKNRGKDQSDNDTDADTNTADTAGEDADITVTTNGDITSIDIEP